MVFLTLVHGSLIDGLWLQSNVSCGKDEGQCGQNNTVNAANNCQRISPTNAAKAHLETVRFRSANLPEVVRVPSKRKSNAADDHAYGWGSTIEKMFNYYETNPSEEHRQVFHFSCLVMAEYD